MKHWLLSCGMALMLFVGASSAQAQSCTITIGSLSSTAAYDPFSGLTNDTQGSFSFTCTRPAGNANRYPTSFWVGVDNGLNFSGTPRLLASGNYLGYALYQDYPGCATTWGGTGGFAFANSNTKNPDTVPSTNPMTGTFCFRMPASQLTGVPSTSYSDTVTISVRSTNSAGFLWGSTTFNLSTTLNASCGLTSPPGTLSISYTSFAGSDVSNTSAFQLRCTNTTAYLMSLDTTTGSLLGLNYTLSLLPSNIGTGSGVAQNYSVQGTVASGQSGTCAAGSCNSSQAHTLTITY